MVLAALVTAPVAAAPQAGRFSDSAAYIDNDGQAAVAAHEGGRIELAVVRIDGTPRLSLTFIDRDGRRGAPPATLVSLELARATRRPRRIFFQDRGGRAMSTTPVERLTGGSVLSVTGSHAHRVKLLARPTTRKPR